MRRPLLSLGLALAACGGTRATAGSRETTLPLAEAREPALLEQAARGGDALGCSRLMGPRDGLVAVTCPETRVRIAINGEPGAPATATCTARRGQVIDPAVCRAVVARVLAAGVPPPPRHERS